MVGHPSLGIIGAGKVGTALAVLLSRSGCEVRTVFSRTEANGRRLAEVIGAQTTPSAAAAAEGADLILLTVPDDSIEAVALGLQDVDWTGKGAVHTSGALDASCLEALAARGAMTGSFHPVFPFASLEQSLAGLPGAAFAIETRSPVLHDWLGGLAEAIGSSWFDVPGDKKALYHCALVMASNYLVTLYAVAEQMLAALGVEPTAIRRALNTLVQGTADNLRDQGIPLALTGPLTRADAGTVRSHLRALASYDRDVMALYRMLAQLTVPVVAQRGLPTEWIETLINQEE